MVHEYHEGLPGYSPEQIWHDGCPECESRGEHISIYTLDRSNFRRAWNRAAKLNATGLQDGARAEYQLLHVLAMVQNQGATL